MLSKYYKCTGVHESMWNSQELFLCFTYLTENSQICFFCEKKCAFPKIWARNLSNPAKAVKTVSKIARKTCMKNSFVE